MRPFRTPLWLLCLLPSCGGGDSTADMLTGAPPAGTVGDFVREQPGIVATAIDDQHVYWADSNGFIRAASTSIAERYEVTNTGGAFINRLAVDSDRVYWSSTSPAGVGWAPKDGGPPTRLVTLPGTTPAFGLAVDGDHVYFTTGGGGELGRIKKDGTGQAVIAHDSGNFGEVVVDGTYAYYENTYVFRVPVGGGVDPIKLDSPMGFHGQLAHAGDFVYEWVASNTTGAALLIRIPKNGKPQEQLANVLGDAVDVTIEGSNAFCIATNNVLQIALTGGMPVSVAKDEYRPRHVVVNARGIFWASAAALRWAVR